MVSILATRPVDLRGSSAVGLVDVKLAPSERYQRLARMHREAVAMTATLATRLRLTPSSKLDRRTPQDGELSVA
jgi:hypothetical protein